MSSRPRPRGRNRQTAAEAALARVKLRNMRRAPNMLHTVSIFEESEVLTTAVINAPLLSLNSNRKVPGLTKEVEVVVTNVIMRTFDEVPSARFDSKLPPSRRAPDRRDKTTQKT